MSSYIVSIIVPIYNSEKTLEKCLDSLINLSDDSYEIVLVDDGSTDNSRLICDKYIKKYDYISYYYKQNSGVSDTRNYGIDHSSGKYITFVDSDDYVDQNYIHNATKYINNNYDMIVYDHIIIDSNGKVLEENNLYNVSCDISYPKCINSYFETYCLSTACKTFYLRKMLKDNKIYFDKRIGYGEDMLFSINAYLNSKKTYYINYIGYYYVMNNDSASHNDSYDKRKKYLYDNYMLYNQIELLLNDKKIEVDKNLFLDAMLKNMIHGIDRIYNSNLDRKQELINLAVSKYKNEIKKYSIFKSSLNIKYKIKMLIIKTKLYFLLNIIYRI